MTDTPALPSVHLDCWTKEYWTTTTRYYVAEIMQDLWGTWVLRRSWGGLDSHRGSSKIIAAKDYDHALKLLEEVAKQRKARHYTRIP